VVKLNKIYTRTGDDGTTGLVDGSRVAKSDARMAAIGDVDEANSAIGVARTHFLDSESFDMMLARIQNDLFDLGADLATPLDGDQTYALRVTAAQSEWLEHSIDRMNTALEPLRSFVLPAGEPGAAALHLARAIARRAERSTVAASASADIRPEVLIYLNRLSDFLFVAARAVNQSGAGDVLWVPGASR
jgi:cob(I)alamin adenosyltransferase